MTLGHLCLDDPETVTYYPGGTKNNASTPQTQPRTYPKGNFSKKLNALLSNYLQCVELYYSVRVKDGAKVVNAENMAVMVDEKVPVPPTERANDEALMRLKDVAGAFDEFIFTLPGEEKPTPDNRHEKITMW